MELKSPTNTIKQLSIAVAHNVSSVGINRSRPTEPNFLTLSKPFLAAKNDKEAGGRRERAATNRREIARWKGPINELTININSSSLLQKSCQYTIQCFHDFLQSNITNALFKSLFDKYLNFQNSLKAAKDVVPDDPQKFLLIPVGNNDPAPTSNCPVILIQYNPVKNNSQLEITTLKEDLSDASTDVVPKLAETDDATSENKEKSDKKQVDCNIPAPCKSNSLLKLQNVNSTTKRELSTVTGESKLVWVKPKPPKKEKKILKSETDSVVTRLKKSVSEKLNSLFQASTSSSPPKKLPHEKPAPKRTKQSFSENTSKLRNLHTSFTVSAHQHRHAIKSNDKKAEVDSVFTSNNYYNSAKEKTTEKSNKKPETVNNKNPSKTPPVANKNLDVASPVPKKSEKAVINKAYNLNPRKPFTAVLTSVNKSSNFPKQQTFFAGKPRGKFEANKKFSPLNFRTSQFRRKPTLDEKPSESAMKPVSNIEVQNHLYNTASAQMKKRIKEFRKPTVKLPDETQVFTPKEQVFDWIPSLEKLNSLNKRFDAPLTKFGASSSQVSVIESMRSDDGSEYERLEKVPVEGAPITEEKDRRISDMARDRERKQSVISDELPMEHLHIANYQLTSKLPKTGGITETNNLPQQLTASLPFIKKSLLSNDHKSLTKPMTSTFSTNHKQNLIGFNQTPMRKFYCSVQSKRSSSATVGVERKASFGASSKGTTQSNKSKASKRLRGGRDAACKNYELGELDKTNQTSESKGCHFTTCKFKSPVRNIQPKSDLIVCEGCQMYKKIKSDESTGRCPSANAESKATQSCRKPCPLHGEDTQLNLPKCPCENARIEKRERQPTLKKTAQNPFQDSPFSDMLTKMFLPENKGRMPALIGYDSEGIPIYGPPGAAFNVMNLEKDGKPVYGRGGPGGSPPPANIRAFTKAGAPVLEPTDPIEKMKLTYLGVSSQDNSPITGHPDLERGMVYLGKGEDGYIKYGALFPPPPVPPEECPKPPCPIDPCDKRRGKGKNLYPLSYDIGVCWPICIFHPDCFPEDEVCPREMGWKWDVKRYIYPNLEHPKYYSNPIKKPGEMMGKVKRIIRHHRRENHVKPPERLLGKYYYWHNRCISYQYPERNIPGRCIYWSKPAKICKCP